MLRFFFMDATRFETDELTGLPKWPVLLNGDWSQWTEEPCAILFGEADLSGDRHISSYSDELLQKAAELLRSPDWPRLTPFWLGRGGFLVLAPSYSPGQALLLAQWINRELGALKFPRLSWVSQPPNMALTWGMAITTKPGWDLPLTLKAAIASVQHAIREKRFGSINETLKGSTTEDTGIFWVCSRHDPLTELKMWGCTAALCSNYADESVALLLGNIDRFKNCCDSYGHGPSDVVLQMIAHVLRRFESNDVATFRFGGDEFGVWVRGQSLDRARQLAEQINAQIGALEVPVPGSPNSINNISLTWAVIAGSAHQIEMPGALLKARELLEAAKNQQRGSIKAERL